MKYDVFISYSSVDKAIADAICHNLEEHDIRCWIAPRDIAAGQNWAAAIMQAIRECEVMVLVYTSSSNQSTQVANEVDKAFTNKKTIIPFLVEDTPMCDDLGYYLSRKHWLEAYPDYRNHLKPLLATVQRFLGRDMGGQASQPVRTDRNVCPPTPSHPFIPPCPSVDSYWQEQWRLAHIGNSRAMAEVGLGYSKGKFGPPNHCKAVEWIQKSANAGNGHGLNLLGEYYHLGIHVKQNDRFAVSTWFKAAAKNNSTAMNWLGTAYRHGWGIEKDLSQAIKWYEKAISAGESKKLLQLDIEDCRRERGY